MSSLKKNGADKIIIKKNYLKKRSKNKMALSLKGEQKLWEKKKHERDILFYFLFFTILPFKKAEN